MFIILKKERKKEHIRKKKKNKERDRERNEKTKIARDNAEKTEHQLLPLTYIFNFIYLS